MKIGILPELMGKWFSSIPIGAVNNMPENAEPEAVPQLPSALEQNDTSSNDENPRKKWCYCQKPSDSKMIHAIICMLH